MPPTNHLACGERVLLKTPDESILEACGKGKKAGATNQSFSMRRTRDLEQIKFSNEEVLKAGAKGGEGMCHQPIM